MDTQVRVRFAPSPTGYLHVGGVRTLLFNWLYAKKTKGTLVLRVEDTDQARSTRASEAMVLEDIAQLGLSPEEGPIQGGPHHPYRQSERMELYAKFARQLLDGGKAYFCFCTPDLIASKREAALKLGRVPHYDGTCARQDRAAAEARIKKGERAGLRFRAPESGVFLEDAVRGRIEFGAGSVGDFMITRSPTDEERQSGKPGADVGMPVYNFCCVVDDHLMGMTHVIRGEDHLSNTARQLMVYEGLGWNKPIFAHIAMVLGADRQKLSKRNGDVSARDYLNKGYLPEALLNFLSLLGWWPPQGYQPRSGHPEILSIDELSQVFGLEGLQKAPAVFDMQKLDWMNGFYIKHLDRDSRYLRSKPYVDVALTDRWSPQELTEWMDLFQGDATVLSDWNRLLHPYVALRHSFDETETSALRNLLMGEPGVMLLQHAEIDLKGEAELKELPLRVAKSTGLKGKALFMPLRMALTGQAHGPELGKVLGLIGRDALLIRLAAVQRLVQGA